MVFSGKVTWRFARLNEAFNKVVGQSHRTESLHVYSNAGRGVIVGNQTTDLLREVPHLKKGEWKNNFVRCAITDWRW